MNQTNTILALTLTGLFFLAGAAFGFANVAIVIAVIAVSTAIIAGLVWLNIATYGAIGFILAFLTI